MTAHNTDYRTTDELIRDLQRNFATRRLLLIALHVLVPAFMLTCIAIVSTSTPVPGYQFLFSLSVELSAIAIIVASFTLAHSMARCHRGITLNGAVLNARLYKIPVDPSINPSGVSVSFFELAVFSILVAAFVAGYRSVTLLFKAVLPLSVTQSPTAPWISSVLMILVLMLLFRIAKKYFAYVHTSTVSDATSISKDSFETDDNCLELVALHRMNSLDDTNNDVGVVVVTAVALFSALLSTMGTSMNINEAVSGKSWAEALKSGAVPVLTTYGIAVMWLSQRMILRLRVAVSEHSSMLVDRHGQPNFNTWTARFTERTHVLYLLLWIMLLMLASVLIEYLFSNTFTLHLVAWVVTLAFAVERYDDALANEAVNFRNRYAEFLDSTVNKTPPPSSP